MLPQVTENSSIIIIIIIIILYEERSENIWIWADMFCKYQVPNRAKYRRIV
jgi:hypothetical protein